jgi:hypothetical protein
MQHQWLISELEGLRDYAALNGLPALAAHLDQARLLALTEIASAEHPEDQADHD